MAVLIPSLGACTSRMTSGERRFAERLEQKLDDDYLIWYDVPVGPKQSHPDFVIIHPGRGLLILETKDWRLDTIRKADKQAWEIIPQGQLKVVINPIAQARHCAIQVVNALERDPQLRHADGPYTGKLLFPWGHGTVFTNITRKQFTDGGLGNVIEPHLAICRDEMTESVDVEAFQRRLWEMFPHSFGGAISLPQLDRVRWILFPQVRVPAQGVLFADADKEAEADVPDIVRVMDLQQEQLARSLGDGHRVIHGVAGSGKTMILGYRAEQLAQGASSAKPVLILCYNEPLAVKLAAHMDARGLSDRVHARNFHKWCHQQLKAYGQTFPDDGPRFFEEMVAAVIRAVERKQIPSGQYLAVLVDEGHDFQPEWLKLITQMVDPHTNSLLLLYDDAQSIYERRHSKQFSFKSVGIQAQGRTTILRINYRNTKQVLQTANLIAGDLLTAEEKDEDGVPLVTPLSCGREGPAPIVVRLPNLRDEARSVAEHFAAAHEEGFAWREMAVICRRHSEMEACSNALTAQRVPHKVRRGSGTFNPSEDTIKVLTMHACKGLEFPVVAIVGTGQMPGDDREEDARLFYVAATRATNRLVITLSGDGEFSRAFPPDSAVHANEIPDAHPDRGL
jgi:hypothetical protein